MSNIEDEMPHHYPKNEIVPGSIRHENGGVYADFAPVKQEGRKDDTGKLPYDLLPPELLESVCKVLQFGANKYAPRNWEKGMGWGRVFSALMRHLWSWWRGDAIDPETGFSHLWHAGACLSFLIAYEQRGVGTDDRPTKTTKQVLGGRDERGAVSGCTCKECNTKRTESA